MLAHFNNTEELNGWKLYDYELVEGGHSCKLCGHHIKNVFKIKNEKENQFSELGSECVRKVATSQNMNSMLGITLLPQAARKQVKNNKNELTEEEKVERWGVDWDALPY